MRQVPRYATIALQLLLVATFTAIPVSRMLGGPLLQQVLDLGAPEWLVWVANAVELAGAGALLAGLRWRVAAVAGAALLGASMTGATALHVRAGNLFDEAPWTLVILGLCLVVAAANVRAARMARQRPRAGGGRSGPSRCRLIRRRGSHLDQPSTAQTPAERTLLRRGRQRREA